MRRFLQILKKDQAGATSIEYALIAAVMGITLIPVLGDLNSGVVSIYGVLLGLFDQF